MTAFAKVTERHEIACRGLYPASKTLYLKLIRDRPAGKEQELHLEHFCEWSGEHCREKPYSLRQTQRALAQLINRGLVQVVFSYTAKIFKLIAYHPEQVPPSESVAASTEMSVDTPPMSRGTPQMSEIGGSNPHSAVPLTEDLEQQTASTHPVVAPEVNKREIGGTAKKGFAPDEEICQERNLLFAEAEQAISPQPLNPVLRSALTQVEFPVARAAIAAVKEQIARGGVRNPGGLLTTALRQKWQPAEKPSGVNVPFELEQWYPQAIAEGVVEDVPVTALPVMNGEHQVRVPNPGGPIPYELRPWRQVKAEMEAGNVRPVQSGPKPKLDLTSFKAMAQSLRRRRGK